MYIVHLLYNPINLAHLKQGERMNFSQTSNGFDIVRDALETDVYNVSVINAVLQLYPLAIAECQIVERDYGIYPKGFAGLLTEKLQDLRGLKSHTKLRNYLKQTWKFIHPVFFEWLAKYRFNPDNIKMWQDEDGHLYGSYKGMVVDIIFTEQITMMVTSQIRNEVYDWYPDDNWEDEYLRIIEVFVEKQMKFAEFGLRRRAFTWMHDRIAVLNAQFGGDSYVGSSSPYHCEQTGFIPKGTVNHFWYLLHGARYGIEDANELASLAWRAVYGNDLGTALPDTWGRRLYFSTVAPGMTQMINSYRHDSDEPKYFTDDLVAYFTHPRNRRDLKGVTAMFTDSVNDITAPKIYDYANQWFNVSFGIGGALTNNKRFFKKTPAYRPLNMVAKPVAFSFNAGKNFTKIAKVPDGKGKNVGDPNIIAEIERIKTKYPWVY